MALLALQDVDVDGLSPAYSAAGAGGDTVNPRGSESIYLHVKNGSVGAITVTIDDPTSKSPVGAAAFNPDLAVPVPAGQERKIHLSPLSRFVNASDKLVHLSYSSAGSVTIGAFRLS